MTVSTRVFGAERRVFWGVNEILENRYLFTIENNYLDWLCSKNLFVKQLEYWKPQRENKVSAVTWLLVLHAAILGVTITGQYQFGPAVSPNHISRSAKEYIVSFKKTNTQATSGCVVST